VCCIRNCVIVRSLERGIQKFFTRKKLFLDVRLDVHHHHQVTLCSHRPHACQVCCVPLLNIASFLHRPYIGTPLCRRARTHEFKLQGSYKGLKQASRLCERGAILMMTVPVQSQVLFTVSDYTQFEKNCQETLL